MTLGLFDPDLGSGAWFDRELSPAAWFDPDLIAAPSGADVTPPGTISATPTRVRISAVPGRDSYDIAFSADEAFVEYDIRVVPATSSINTAGTRIKTATVASRTSDTITVTEAEVVAASGGAGTFIIKVFLKDAAGNWST